MRNDDNNKGSSSVHPRKLFEETTAIRPLTLAALNATLQPRLTPPPPTSFENFESRSSEAAKQLFCGGLAGSVAKTVTAPFSRLTILFQVHSMVTTREHRPLFAMSLRSGVKKIIDRGGIRSLWKGNMTSVLHRFPYSAINFYVYENTLDALVMTSSLSSSSSGRMRRTRPEERNETPRQLVRRVTSYTGARDPNGDDQGEPNNDIVSLRTGNSNDTTANNQYNNRADDTPAMYKFIAGAAAGTMACVVCYPLDLVRTRLTTELEGREHYRGILDAFRKINATEGFRGFYSGIVPTLLVAVPNFAISYTAYGTLKEHLLDDELFYNLRRIDADSGEPRLGLSLTLLSGAASGILATLVTFPMDTIRRRMQIQTLHLPPSERLTPAQHIHKLVTKEGLRSLYWGLTPEIMKVIPMVGTMFFVYEWARDIMKVGHDHR